MLNTLSFGGLFLEGLLSFFSPCVLPLIPLYMGYLTRETAVTDAEGHTRYSRGKTMWMTLWFVLGISTVFFLAGLGASAFHSFFTQNQTLIQLIGGLLLVLFGLIALDVIRIPWLEQEHKLELKDEKGSRKSGWVKAWLMGFVFSFAWSPCIGPMLASAIVVAASASTRAAGYGYILAYALGFILMFLLLGLFTEEMLNFFQKKKDIVKYTRMIGGIIILCFGAYMLYSSFTRLSAETASVQPSASASAEPSAEATADTRTDVEKYGFTLPDSDGNMVSLSDFSGKTVIVNFFGTWCTYCQKEMPSLQNVNDTRDDVKILLIAAPNSGQEGSIAEIKKYMADKGYTMQILYDTDLSITKEYGISGYPTTYIVKPDGNFLGYVPGYLSEENLNKALEAAVK